MDIEKHFFFMVVDSCDAGEHEDRLDGVDFHGGLGSLLLQRLAGGVWLVDQSGQRPLAGELCLVHQQRIGNVLMLREQQISTFPCLLTTDSEFRWAFSGVVRVETNEGSFDAADLRASGIPLCGKNWLGVLRSTDGGLWLDAYATGSNCLGNIVSAFCPDWTDGFDDDDALIFTLEKGVAHSPPKAVSLSRLPSHLAEELPDMVRWITSSSAVSGRCGG